MSEMIGAFTFNNIHSSHFNLVARSVKRPLLPAAKVKRVELPAASGVYDFTDLEYTLREITMRIMYIGRDYYELRSRARSIAAWLSTPGWAKLILDDERDLYYNAKLTGEMELAHFWESGSIDCVFDCQPFAYSVEEKQEVFVSGGTFINPGTREINYKSPQGSKSIVRATGSNMSVSMNGKTITCNRSGVLTLNNIDMTASLDGVANAFPLLGGDYDTFFKIVPGSNTISSSGVTSLTVEYIPMWI